MDDLTDGEEHTWNTLKYGYNIQDYKLVKMKIYRETEGDVEVFLYIHLSNLALSITKVMVDGIDIPTAQFVSKYEPETRFHYVEMYRPFHFQATFRW